MNITREGPIKIGVKTIESAWRRRTKDARLVVTDSERPGLALITNATSQSWAYSYKPRGLDPVTGKRFNTKTMTIGSPTTYSPDQARAEANRLKDTVSAGGDPAADRKAAIDKATRSRAATVERAVANYLVTLPTKPKKSGGRISEAWANEQAAHLNRAVAVLGIASDPLASVDTKTVRGLQHGPAYRHRFGALNRFLDWCVHEDRITANPAASIGRAFRPAAGGKRDRTPTLRELALIWEAAGRALEPVFCDFMRFAICVPARRSEIARLDWRRIDFDVRVWRQLGKAAKNRDWHELRLPPLALEILTRRWEAAGRPKTGLVFPSPLSGTVITAFSGMLRTIHKAAPGVERWAFHDLRRSFASVLGQVGQDDEATIDAVLNHRRSASRGGVIGVYNKSTRLPAQRAAVERWGALLAGALEGRFPKEAEVFPLARRAKV
jgi:integrase